MCYEIRAIFGNKDKASKMQELFKTLSKLMKNPNIYVLPEVEEYERGTYCFYIQINDPYIYEMFNQIIEESDGAAFVRAI